MKSQPSKAGISSFSTVHNPLTHTVLQRMSCKSTQRYKERKQFTTPTFSFNPETGCKSTQRYKERKQFTTGYFMLKMRLRCKSTQRYKERKQFTTVKDNQNSFVML